MSLAIWSVRRGDDFDHEGDLTLRPDIPIGWFRRWAMAAVLVAFLLPAMSITVSRNVDIVAGLTGVADRSALDTISRLVRTVAIAAVFLCIRDVYRAIMADLIVVFGIFVLAISMIWSLDVYVTFSASVNLILLFCLCSLAIQYCGARIATRVIWSAAALLLTVSSVLALLGSNYAVVPSGAWRGLFATKNAFGGFCAVLLLFSVFGTPFSRRWRVIRTVVVALCIAGLVGSQSVGATLALLLATSAAAAHLMLEKVRTRAPDLYLNFVLLVLILFGLLAGFFPALVTALGRDLTLTGRTNIWRTVLPLTFESPLGHGYGLSGGDAAFDLTSQHSRTYSRAIDNAYIVLALDMGWLFVAGYVSWLASIALRPLRGRAASNLGSVFLAALATYMLLLGIVEKSGGPYLNFALLVLLLFRSAERDEALRARSPGSPLRAARRYWPTRLATPR